MREKKNSTIIKRGLVAGLLTVSISVPVFAAAFIPETEAEGKSVEKYDYSTLEAGSFFEHLDDTDSSLKQDVCIEVTEAEILEELEASLAYYPVYEKITGKKISDTDAVNIDYTMTSEDGEVSAGSAVRLDLTDSLTEIKECLAGRLPGEDCHVSVTFPDDYEGNYTGGDGMERPLAGTRADFSIAVNYVYGNEKTADAITDADIQELTGGEYENREELYAFLREEILESRKSDALDAIWEKLTTGCTVRKGKRSAFRKLAKKEYDYELSYYRQAAQASGKALSDLAEDYGYEEETAFLASVKEESEAIVKHYLIAYAIAEREGLLLTPEELLVKKEEILGSYGASCVEELEETYGATEVKLYLQMQQIDSFLLEALAMPETAEP